MKRYRFLLMMLLISFSCSSQNNYSEKEKKFLDLFKSFTDYIKTKTDITDSTQLKYLMQEYLFVDAKIPSNEKIEVLKKQVKTFNNFLQKDNLAENISAVPVRFADDKSVYNHLSSFQKENTLVFFDKRSPKKIIGYILFMPPVAKVISEPRIWSWTLTFQYGKYMFRSVTGEEGYEYIFTPR